MPNYGAPTVADLESISDVHVSSPQNGQALLWDSVSAKWVNGYGVIAPVQFTPANPATTTSVAPVMMGLALSYTATSTAVKVMAQVTLSNDFSGDSCHVQISHGTGVAPVNGHAVVGTQDGKTATMLAANGGDVNTLTAVALVSGLTIGATYWFDMTYNNSMGAGGGDVSATNIVIVVG